jgi:Concanavalin A-like lectin/glucanases superfamily/Domain of unknown function (DUF1929)/Bacterial Ig domain
VTSRISLQISRSCLAAALAIGLVALWAAPGAAHTKRAGKPGDLGVPGMSERELRTFETQVLGPDHAAEHARARSDLREGELEGASVTAQAAAAPVSTDPAVVGRWSAPFSIPVMGIHAAMLPTGKLMWWSYPINPNRPYGDPSYPNTAQAWLWDPATGTTKRVDPPLVREPDTGQMVPANIWCSGQSFLADGRLLVTGGNLRYQGAGNPPAANYEGLNKVYTFNPFNETWTEQPDMAHGRWYPSQVLLPDGRSVIVSGFDESGGGYASTNKDIEIFTPSADLNGRGTIARLGGRGGSAQPPDGGLYPHLWVMPSGRVLLAGPDPNDSWFLNDPGPGNVFSWGDFAPASRRRLWGSGVLRPAGPEGSTKVTLIGGSQPNYSTTPPSGAAGVPTTETFDESNSAGGWQPGASMNIGRSHLNTVLLPDGSMVTVGGGIGTREPEGQWAADPEQRQVELYNPATNSWSLGAAQAESRAYHSTAVLLPDARVISAGDDVNGGIDRDTAEIYEPPYLFKGPRPSITTAPSTIQVGQSFAIDTAGASVQRAVLVAPAATTHANDMNQRVVPLAGSMRSGGLNLTAPPSNTVAPPGYYMLFALSDQGVPSVAKWVKLTPSASSTPAGLVAAYSFNEGSGSTAADTSGKGNGGTLAGATWTTAGRNGGALSFDGANDMVSVADSNSLDLTSGMTLEAWVKPRVVTNWRTTILKERPSNLAYALYASTNTNKPNVEAPPVSLYGPSGLGANTWSHLAATSDGSTVRLFVNGNQVASRSRTGSLPTSGSPLRIGGNTVWGEWFDGVIDDVRVYNRALSPGEIAADRDTPVGGSTPPPPPPPTDTTPPSVSISAPATGATVSGTVNVTAAASDNVGVAGVQFRLDGANLGSEDTALPYSTSWNTSGVANGSHDLTAVARDAAGNTTTSAKVTVTVQNQAPPPSGLVAAYSFNETSGSLAADASSQRNTGTVSGAAWTASGRNGGALSFDGVNDWVTVPDSNSLDLSRTMTLEAWVRPSLVTNWRTVIIKEKLSGLAYALYASTDTNKPNVEAAPATLYGPSSLTANTWAHLAATSDGSTLRLYVNGSQVASKASSTLLSATTGPLRIGGNAIWGEFFGGLIDDVRLYNRALSAAEVQADRDTPVPLGTP